MEINRRTTIGILASVTFPAPSWAARRSQMIEVELSVTDPNGTAISFPTIWGYVSPRRSPLTLGAEDLWRVTDRYQKSSEFAVSNTPYRPVPMLSVWPLGNAQGIRSIPIDYERLEGAGSQRPAELKIGFTAMKQGFRPGRLDIVCREEKLLRGRIVLTPESTSVAWETGADFDSLLFRLSELDLDEPSDRIHQQLVQLRRELETIAARAASAGNQKLAARIYARMQYLPQTRIVDGRVAAITRSDPYSSQSWDYLGKAYGLDSSNPYIAAEYLFRRGSDEFGGNRYHPDSASAERRRAFEDFLQSLHVLMRMSGTEIWPEFHKLYALWHRKSSDPSERSRLSVLLKILYESEPKYETRENLLLLSG